MTPALVFLLPMLFIVRNLDRSIFLLAVGAVTLLMALCVLHIGFRPLLTVSEEGVWSRKWPRPLRWDEMDGVWMHWAGGDALLEFALRDQAVAPSASFFSRAPQRVAKLGGADIHPARIVKLIAAELESRRGEPPEELRLPLELSARRRLEVPSLALVSLFGVALPLLVLGPTPSGFAVSGIGLVLPLAQALAALASGRPLLTVTAEGVQGGDWIFFLPWTDMDKIELVRVQGWPQLRFHIADHQKYLPYFPDRTRRNFSPDEGLSIDVSMEYADVNRAALRQQIEAEMLRRRGAARQLATLRARSRHSRHGLGTWRR